MKRIIVPAVLVLSSIAASAVAQGVITAPVPVVFSGTYDANVIVVEMDAAHVQSLLPPSLELAPQTLTAPGKHPVVSLNLSYLSFSTPSPVWSETAYIVPNTRLKNGAVDCVEGKNGPFSFMPVLHVNSAVPLAFNELFGLNQHLATINKGSTYIMANTLDVTAPLSLLATYTGDAPLSETGKTNIVPLKTWLNAPVLGKNSAGTLLWSQTDWHFDDGAVASVTNSTLAAVSPQWKSINVVRSGVNSSPLGTFHITAPFEATAPVACVGL